MAPTKMPSELTPSKMKLEKYEAEMAERGGFEPPVQFLTVRRFSKPLLSTTQPPLRFYRT